MEGYKKTSEIFTNDAIIVLEESLKMSKGQEVYWGCFLNDSKTLIVRVETIFFGSSQSVIFSSEKAIKYDLVLHNHPNNIVEPSEDDQLIAHHCMKISVGFAIIDNILENCYILIPPHKIFKREKINISKVENIFLKTREGISRYIENYKIRDSQIDLSKLIMKTINDDKVSFIEAPTGIGKSLAYLLPVLLYIKNNKVKTIISTYTKNLQNQLFIKDIPSAQKIINTNLQIEIAYGRQNYLCLLAFSNFKESYNNLFSDLVEKKQIDQFEEWVKNTKDGLLLNIISDFDKKILDEVKSSSNQCLGNKCKFYSDCFYFEARKRLNNADIIISNHHFLLSYELNEDLSDSLPIYNTVIFDEGHNLPDVIESLSTIAFSTFEIQKRLLKLYQDGQKNIGFLPFLELKIHQIKNLNQKLKIKIIETINNLKLTIPNLIKLISQIHVRSVFDILNIISNYKDKESSNKKLLNLTELCNERNDEFMSFFSLVEQPFESLSEISNSLFELSKMLQILIENNNFDDLDSTIQFIYANLKSNLRFFGEINQFYQELIELTKKNQISSEFLKVLWLEISNNVLHFYYYNEEIGCGFKNIIKTKAKSSIIISATLSAENSFEYMKNQLYLNERSDKEFIEKIYPSIFPYQKNSCFFILEGINPLNKSQYKKDMIEIIKKIINFSKAKTMILTTSYNDIKDITEAIKNHNNGINLFSQNENFFNNQLLESFKKSKTGILVANMSYWEGVDLIGKNLEILLITKLPFKVPDTPILQAKTQRLEKQGLNSFMLLSLPYAIIKLKQGFGRLIRSEEETGICVIFDDRIITKRYGQDILKSLPNSKIEIISKDKFIKEFQIKCKELSITI